MKNDELKMQNDLKQAYEIYMRLRNVKQMQELVLIPMRNEKCKVEK